MRIDVAILPVVLPEPPEAVCIIVDVLRASSSAATLFDAGVESITVAVDVEEARAIRGSVPAGALLCGEVGGLPPEGFDYGNSPVEFSALELAGHHVIMATSNGTRALARAAAAPAILVGSLLNRGAAARAALEAARETGAGITVVCSGNDYGRSFSLEDLLGAGALVAGIESLLVAERDGDSPEVTDAALVAARLYDFYSEDLAGGLKAGSHGRSLARLGFHADLEFCAQLDSSPSVPRLRQEGELLILGRVSPAGGGC